MVVTIIFGCRSGELNFIALFTRLYRMLLNFLREKVISEIFMLLIIFAFAVMILSFSVSLTSSKICSKFSNSSSALYLYSSFLTSVNSLISLCIFANALSTIFNSVLNSFSSFGDTSLNKSIANTKLASGFFMSWEIVSNKIS